MTIFGVGSLQVIAGFETSHFKVTVTPGVPVRLTLNALLAIKAEDAFRDGRVGRAIVIMKSKPLPKTGT
jgi:hypothetical protein